VRFVLPDFSLKAPEVGGGDVGRVADDELEISMTGVHQVHGQEFN